MGYAPFKAGVSDPGYRSPHRADGFASGIENPQSKIENPITFPSMAGCAWNRGNRIPSRVKKGPLGDAGEPADLKFEISNSKFQFAGTPARAEDGQTGLCISFLDHDLKIPAPGPASLGHPDGFGPRGRQPGPRPGNCPGRPADRTAQRDHGCGRRHGRARDAP